MHRPHCDTVAVVISSSLGQSRWSKLIRTQLTSMCDYHATLRPLSTHDRWPFDLLLTTPISDRELETENTVCALHRHATESLLALDLFTPLVWIEYIRSLPNPYLIELDSIVLPRGESTKIAGKYIHGPSTRANKPCDLFAHKNRSPLYKKLIDVRDEVKEHAYHAYIEAYPMIYKHYCLACITRIAYSIFLGIMSHAR